MSCRRTQRCFGPHIALRSWPGGPAQHHSWALKMPRCNWDCWSPSSLFSGPHVAIYRPGCQAVLQEGPQGTGLSARMPTQPPNLSKRDLSPYRPLILATPCAGPVRQHLQGATRDMGVWMWGDLSASQGHGFQGCDRNLRTGAGSGSEDSPWPVCSVGLYLGYWDAGAEQHA